MMVTKVWKWENGEKIDQNRGNKNLKEGIVSRDLLYNVVTRDINYMFYNQIFLRQHVLYVFVLL